MSDAVENLLYIVSGMLLVLIPLAGSRVLLAIDEAWRDAEKSQQELQGRHGESGRHLHVTPSRAWERK